MPDGTEQGQTGRVFIEVTVHGVGCDGNEVRYCWDLSAAGLPLRSVRVGNAACAFDSAGRRRGVGEFGCGTCQDRHSSPADDGSSGDGPRIALPGVLGGDLCHQPEPSG